MTDGGSPAMWTFVPVILIFGYLYGIVLWGCLDIQGDHDVPPWLQRRPGETGLRAFPRILLYPFVIYFGLGWRALQQSPEMARATLRWLLTPKDRGGNDV